MKRLDFWLDSGNLMGMGFLEASEVQNHQSLLLIASINQDLEIEIEGKTQRISMALIDSRVDYRIVKGEDWQFFTYIPESTKLGMLLRDRLKGEKQLVTLRHGEAEEWLTPFLTDSFDDFQAEELLHFLLREIGGIYTYPQNWSQDLGGILEILSRGFWARVSISSIAEELDLTVGELESHFFRLSGIPLKMYLYHRRVGESFDRLNRGFSLDKACRDAGMPGIEAASDYFHLNFNINLKDLLEQKPTMRFMAGPMDRLYGYSIKSESSESS